jgi:amino acid transporter
MGVTKLLLDDVKAVFGNAVDILEILFLDFIIIGLAFIAFARNKVENELTVRKKAVSAISTFIFAIIVVVISPFISMAFGSDTETFNIEQLIMTMLFLYIFNTKFVKIKTVSNNPVN